MSFYPNDPTVNEITMCTVTAFNPDTGFDVHLDEYNIEGFMVLKELSSKKIKKSISSFLKIGTQLPLCVLEMSDDRAIMSKKDVNSENCQDCKDRYDLNLKLFSLARRLSYTLISAQNQNIDCSGEIIIDLKAEKLLEDEWTALFRDLLDPEQPLDEHIYNMLSNRNKESHTGLDKGRLIIIEHYHAKLFGIKPITIRADITIQVFDINGMNRVKDALLKICDKYRKPDASKDGDDIWTNDELYNNQSAVNVDILPSAIPKFHLHITSYFREQAEGVQKEIQSILEQEKFDVFRFEPIIEKV
jgi:translation initiation factor 2 alpha subunit (eIF-2alpha)